MDVLAEVLHALRLRRIADVDALCEISGQEFNDVDAALGDAHSNGLVSRVDRGRIAGWRLTPAGLTLDRERCAAAGPAVVTAASHAHQRFLALNEPFKRLCVTWQDDHAKGVELATALPALLRDLAPLHADVVDLTVTAGYVISSFTRYRSRFEARLAQIAAGEATALLTPFSGSYHDIWSELHEDLLSWSGNSRTTADGY